MALGRIRTMRTDVHLCTPIASLTDTAWRTFFGLYPLVDDAGRSPADPAFVAGHIFWASPHDVEVVQQALVLLAERSLVKLYEVGGVRYLEIVGWLDDDAPTYQRIDRPQPSRLPAPEDSTIGSQNISTNGSSIGSTTGSPAEPRTDRRRIGSGSGSGLDDPDAAARAIADVVIPAINALAGKAYRPDSETNLKLCRALANAKLTPEQVREAALHEGTPWLGTAFEDKIRPATLLQLKRVRRVIEDIEARKGSTPVSLPIPSNAPRTIDFGDESQWGAV